MSPKPLPLINPLWPTDPSELAPAVPSRYPTSIDLVTDEVLLEMAALLRIACGRSRLPLNKPHRALLCVLATCLQTEIARRHPH